MIRIEDLEHGMKVKVIDKTLGIERVKSHVYSKCVKQGFGYIRGIHKSRNHVEVGMEMDGMCADFHLSDLAPYIEHETEEDRLQAYLNGHISKSELNHRPYVAGMRVKANARALAYVGSGTILNITRDDVLIEFDEHIGGHDGGTGFSGKEGHCWWINKNQILEQLSESDTLSERGEA